MEEQERRLLEEQSRPQPTNSHDYLEDYYNGKKETTTSVVPHLTKGHGTDQRDRCITRLGQQLDQLDQKYLSVKGLQIISHGWIRQSWEPSRNQVGGTLSEWAEDIATLEAYFEQLQRSRNEQSRTAVREAQLAEDEEELRRRRESRRSRQ